MEVKLKDNSSRIDFYTNKLGHTLYNEKRVDTLIEMFFCRVCLFYEKEKVFCLHILGALGNAPYKNFYFILCHLYYFDNNKDIHN